MEHPTDTAAKDLPELILASRSPRRRELLAAAGYRFRVMPPPGAAETGQQPGESPPDLVARLAKEKAASVVAQVAHGLKAIRKPLAPGPSPPKRGEGRVFSDRLLVLGCDTVAECDGEILGKPDDRRHARRMLETLRGRRHRVLSGLCLWELPCGEPDVRVAITTLLMDRLSDRQIEQYLDSGAWQGKAGAFGYQDRLGWVHVTEGSESNVVGLPLETLAEMLEGRDWLRNATGA